MFGKNPIEKADKGDGSVLWVQEVFATIQGEGPFAGRPAIFVRLAGCNLKCHFCDTDFTTSEWRPSLDTLIGAIFVARGDTSRTGGPFAISLVVLTGGEPLRQNLAPFIQRLIEYGFEVQIETAGTLWPDDLDEQFATGKLSLVCSPKTGKVHPKVELYCRHWKYIIRCGEINVHDGLPMMSTQIEGMRNDLYRPPNNDPLIKHEVWVQPCEEYFHEVTFEEGIPPPGPVVDRDSSKRNVDLAARMAMRHGYRLSLQIHKVIGLP